MAGLVASFGSGAMTNSIPEFEDADCILITGSNTSEAHPLISSRIMRDKAKGDKIIVYKYKSKKGYRRKQGHRQLYMATRITAIES